MIAAELPELSHTVNLNDIYEQVEDKNTILLMLYFSGLNKIIKYMFIRCVYANYLYTISRTVSEWRNNNWRLITITVQILAALCTITYIYRIDKALL